MTSLILNSPYAAPSRHWQPGSGGALVEAAGRRPASYEIFDIRNNTRRSEALERVNEIRGRIDVWQVANALAYPKRKDFSRAIFVVAPGLTVKERLRVLYPGEADNIYDEFALCPSEALRQQVNRAEILVDNWHALLPLTPPERSVVKKGRESDEAFSRRVPADVKLSKKQAADSGIDLDEATRWIEGLDRLHKTRGILRTFDLSATPFAPTGKANAEAGLFSWIISDFGLNDAIEAGLVKTPRVVVRDDALPDATTLRSKLYHLYRDDEVADDLNRRGAQAHEPLPKLVQDAYTLLGADWRAALNDWQAAGHTSPPPPRPSKQIESLPERNALEIRWPNVLRVDTIMRPTLVVDWAKVPALTLDPARTPIVAEIAPALGGAADMSKVTRIDLELLPESFRLQRLIFRAAQKAFEQTVTGFSGQRDFLALQLIRLIEEFLKQDKLDIPSLFHQDEARRHILIALNLDTIVQHLMRHVEQQNRERLEPVFDEEQPIGSTRAMRTWYTTKICLATQKSQISHMLADSAWEQHAANLFEMDDRVPAYAKNDHLGFQIVYLWNGVRRRYLPDFLIRLANGRMLVLGCRFSARRTAGHLVSTRELI